MRIAICEDASKDALHLNAALGRYLNANGLGADIERFESGEAFLAAFTPGKYQIVFMDIYMERGGMTGMQTAEKVHEADRDAAIIFTTNSDAFGIAGYRVAVYYILKPVRDAELARAMEKCRAQIERFARTIEIMSARKPVTIRLRDIYYIESQQRACVFVTSTGEIRSNMVFERLSETLDELPFVRCHRSFIVNLTHTADMLNKDFIIQGGYRVPISKTYQQQAQKAFKEFVRAELMNKSL